MKQIASFGCGVDSVAGLLLNSNYDEIIFADTLDELPSTYEYMEYFEKTMIALVQDSSGLYVTKQWGVRILNPDYEPFTGAGLGDVNLDSIVNVLDVVQIVNYILQPDIYPLGEQSLINANVNQDDTVNVLDVVTLCNMILES